MIAIDGTSYPHYMIENKTRLIKGKLYYLFVRGQYWIILPQDSSADLLGAAQIILTSLHQGLSRKATERELERQRKEAAKKHCGKCEQNYKEQWLMTQTMNKPSNTSITDLSQTEQRKWCEEEIGEGKWCTFDVDYISKNDCNPNPQYCE